MRFKAKLAPEQVAVLANVVAPMSKLQDVHQGAILYLDPEFLRIACKNSQSGITCFAELSKSIFLEHRIESASENVIVCQVDLTSLKLALQSVMAPGYHHNQTNNSSNNKRNSQGSQPAQTMVQSLIAQQHQAVVLKLAKRNSLPCLCLEGHATEGSAVEIHQAIPIRILRATEMQYHLPPQINRPQVQLELPLDRPLRALVDKLKTMGPHVYLQASMKGDMTVRLENDGASLACFYHNLQPRWEDEDDPEDGDAPPPITAESSCTLKVDAAKLSHCLQWQQSHLGITNCLVAMVHNEMLVLHVLLRPEQYGFFTYYLPVYCLTDEDLL